MTSFLYSIDVALFRWINEGWSCHPLDVFFTFITYYKHFLIFIVPFVLYLLFNGGEKGRWLVLALFVAILLSDQTTSHLFKLWIERVRPCNTLPGVLTPDGKSPAFSFPSSHAANMGSSMFLLSMAYRRWTPLFVLIALFVGLSRIYLGLHYPSDVLAGYAWGMLMGWGTWWGMEKARSYLQNRAVPKTRSKGRRQLARKNR